jgi:glutamyl-tRNA reductase
VKDCPAGTLLEGQRFARQTVHLAGFPKHQDTGDTRLSRTWVSLGAQALATIIGGRAIHFKDRKQEFRDLDILVSSTAAPHAIITLDKLAPFLRVGRHRPLFMIDLAMPRDIDPAVHNLDGVYLYDLDSLHEMAERTLSVRKQESEKCHQLIEHHVQDFQLWLERTHSSNFTYDLGFCGVLGRRAPTATTDWCNVPMH